MFEGCDWFKFMLEKFYDLKNLKGDIMGGLVAGVIALPLALAFGVQSGLGATYGLYGAIVLGIIAALFGGTVTQISGPTGPMTVVTASLVTAAIAFTGSLESAMGIILLTFLLGGALQLIFGFLNIAQYIKYFPYPVLSGFMSGVGLIIVLLQIYPLMGVSSPKTTLGVLFELPRLAESMNWGALGIGLLTVAVYYITPKITKAIPSPLVALVAGTVTSLFVGVDIPLIGDIPSGLPTQQLGTILSFDPAAYMLIVEFSLILAVLGSIDSLLTSVIADSITKTKHNSNMVLIGQGVGNMLSALLGGIPGAGATKGTVINIKSGGTTRLSGIIHGIFLLTILLGAGQLAAYIPLSVLAGLLIPIGFNIIDMKGLKHLLNVPKSDAAVLVLVFAITTFGSLINAVIIGIVLACILFMKKSSDLAAEKTYVDSLARFKGEHLWDSEIALSDDLKNKIYIKHLYGPLFFGFTSHFQTLIESLDDNIEVLIIRMDRVPHVDQTGMYAMEEAVKELKQKKVPVLLTGLQEQPNEMLRKINIIPDLISEDQIFVYFEDSVDWLQQNLASEAPKLPRPEPDKPVGEPQSQISEVYAD